MSVTTTHPPRFLPDALFFNTFSYLRKEDLAVCSLVCKHWEHLTSNNQLWEVIARRIITGSFQQKCNYKLLVQQESKKIHTNEEILDRIQKFLNKISVGQNGRLTCSLQAYKGAIISLAIKGSREKISDAQENSATHFNFTENWTALNELDIPAVTTDDLPWYESRSVYTTRLEDTAVATLVSGIHENRTIQGILRFPKLSHAHSSPIPMEYRITHIMEKKIQELSDQLDREKKRKCITTAGLLLGSGIICSAFYLKHAQTLGLPSV